MSQMFSPFFLLLFYQALQKRQLHLFLLRNRQQDIFSGKQKKNAHTALLYPRLATFEASCHRHAGITPTSPKRENKKFREGHFLALHLQCNRKKIVYLRN